MRHLRILLYLLLLTSVVNVHTSWRITTWQISESTPQTELKMQTAETTITDSEGNTTTIKTPRNAGETTAEWKARHMDAVNEFKNG